MELAKTWRMDTTITQEEWTDKQATTNDNDAIDADKHARACEAELILRATQRQSAVIMVVCCRTRYGLLSASQPLSLFIFSWSYLSSSLFFFILSFIFSLLLSCFFSLLVISLLVSRSSLPLSLISSLLFSSLLFSSLLFSSLLFSSLLFSSLVLSCLVLSCLVLSCLVLSCLVLSCLVLSCLVLSCLSSFICLLLSCLVSSFSFSCLLVLSRLLLSLFLCLSLSLSPRDVVCCVVWCVSLWSWCCWWSWCVFVCVAARWKNVEKPVCGFKNASVCPFKTSACVPAPRSHVYRHHARMCYHMRAWCRYTGTIWMDTREAGGHRQCCLPEFAHVWLSRASEVHQRNFWIFPIFKLKNRLRTTCPQFLQSFALPDKAVQFQPS